MSNWQHWLWQWLRLWIIAGGIVGTLLGTGPLAPVWADEPEKPPIVYAVLFYSPTCGHCHQVITQDLPPLFETYGEQFEVMGVDVSQPDGNNLYKAAVERFDIASLGVPLLIIGDTVLVGSVDIPQQLPGLIEQHLARGGVGWPDIPGLSDTLAEMEQHQTETAVTEPEPEPDPAQTLAPALSPTSPAGPTPDETLAPTSSPTARAGGGLVGIDGIDGIDGPSGGEETSPPGLWERLSRDPVGNALAVLVLIGMLGVVGSIALTFRSGKAAPPPRWKTWAIPLLSLVGAAVAAYLAYVETAEVTAVCGPVGDCNTVQQSDYARLLGVLPVGTLGLVGYGAILVTWMVGRLARGSLSHLAWLLLFGMALVGTLFSLYLTFLEPFVIGATCAWCLTSAIVMTVLLWVTTPLGKLAASHLLTSSK